MKLPFTVDQLRFRVARNKLIAVAGKLDTVVTSVYRATTALGFEPAAHGRSVTVRYLDEFSCGDPAEPIEAVVDLAPLAARMVNGEALDAHTAGRFEEAAAGFETAARLDPSFELTHTNLACALNRLGRPRDALAALAPLLRDNPVLAYSKVASDPDLQSLTTAPEIAALLPSAPGDVQPEACESEGAPWVGLGGAAVAVIVNEASWGSSQFRVDLEVFEAKSGAHKLRLPLSEWGDRNEHGKVLPARREVLRQRCEQTVGWLRDLGFRADPRATAVNIASLPDSGRLKRTSLRIKHASWQEAGHEVSRYDVWKDGRIVAHFGENRHMSSCRLTYLRSVRALIVEWTTEAPEGCDTGPYTFAELIPIP